MNRVSRVAALCAALLVTLAPAAHAQNQDFNNNGDVIGVVLGDAYVGLAPVNPPITVTANATTNVAISLYVQNDSILNMSGGSVGNSLYAFDNSVVNFSGGNVGDFLSVANHAVVNFSGGNVGDGLSAYESGTLCIFGRNLSATLVDPDFSGVSYYFLSGDLMDGTHIGETLLVQNNSGASFKLINAPAAAIPEPGVVAFGLIAASGVLGLIARKRK